MLDFKEITLSDKGWINECLSFSKFKGCEYTFGNNFLWKDVYNLTVAHYKDFYIVKTMYGYIFPAGEGDTKDIIEVLIECAKEEKQPLVILSANKNSVEKLKPLYNDIIITEQREAWDYIYKADDLASLQGKKYHAKRNHLHRFCENDWSFEPIIKQNINECKQLNDEWKLANSGAAVEESNVVKNGLDNFFLLDFIGGIIRVEGIIQAFTFGEFSGMDTFVIHAEKALDNYQGTYTMINNAFVKYLKSSYTNLEFINREDDVGLENLRKAKLSYYPAFLEEKYKVVFGNGGTI